MDLSLSKVSGGDFEKAWNGNTRKNVDRYRWIKAVTRKCVAMLPEAFHLNNRGVWHGKKKDHKGRYN